ncbi:MAG: oligosaccharide flippase family protein [Roseivirga sp.]|nr:oligosaccharide flippase family protein [Roseivirga sp.]
MSQIKKLAGQTAYYGISSILGRVLNFALVPFYTRILPTEEYGIVINLYGVAAFLNIIYTYGLETSFFRFSTKQKSIDAYHFTSTAILFTSLLLSGVLFIAAPSLITYTAAEANPEYIRYLALIVFIDAIVAIPFAKLRLDDRPVKFAAIRLTVIGITIGLNMLFLLVFPDIMEGKYLAGLQGVVSRVYDPSIGVGYIFIANLIANSLYLPLLFKELRQIRIRFNWSAFKPIFYYAFPIFLMGLAAMFNDQGYAIIFKFLFDDPEAQIGVYGSAFKLSVLMMLGIQAFRYAGEPFFFSHAENKQAPALFAKVLHYFIVFNITIMVGIAVNIELISDVFLGKPGYKEALYVLPVLLLAKLFFGIYVNLSVWFKIKDMTIYGTYFAGIGALITLIGHLWLVRIPSIGYFGSAISALACYLVMCLLCYFKGRKVFKVPYNFTKPAVYLILALAIIYTSNLISLDSVWLQYGIDIIITAGFFLIMYLFERKNFRYKTISEASE